MEILRKLFSKGKTELSNVPSHIAIIMDGNGRWAKRRGLPRSAGHSEGARALERIIEACEELGVKYLTTYAFSTENWSRPQKEVDYLMGLLEKYIKKFDQRKNSNVKVRVIGDISLLSKSIQSEIIKIEQNTKNNTGLNLSLAINYGGRDEINKAVEKILIDFKEGKLDGEKVDSNLFSRYLYTSEIPDPDLILRPSGEFRLSNFLLYQCAYSELWFSKIYWPDFKREHLIEAIADYQRRQRRFGGI